MTFEDSLSVPGEEAELRVETELKVAPFFDPPLPDLPVRISVDGADPVQVRTDRNGEAFAAHKPAGAGMYFASAAPADGARFRTEPVEAGIFVFDPDRPVFICDIDRTISDCSQYLGAMKRIERVRPVPGALDSLRRLAEKFQIVYLSARDHIYLGKTREWLRHHGFPPGPVFVRRIRLWSASSRRHKEIRLREILKPLRGPRVGAGDRAGDVSAYLAAGVLPIMLAKKAPRDLPAGAEHASTWAEVERIALDRA